MRIQVHINHPAHVHLFKNFIWTMEKRGHEVLILASKRNLTYELLDHYKFNYIKIGEYGNTNSQKILNVPLIDFKAYTKIRKEKPDIFVGMGSIVNAHVSFLLNRPCINLTQTEHSVAQYKLWAPFTDTILTPNSFRRNLGRKQIRYNGFHELAYLHPNWFQPDVTVLDTLGLDKNELIIILRFVSWTATHDTGQHGIKDKISLVKELSNYGKVFITSENILPDYLNNYKLNLAYEKIHDLLYYASLYVGEGGTMTSESAALGTHSVLISTEAKNCGVFYDQRKYGLTWFYEEDYNAINMITKLLSIKNLWQDGKRKRERMLKDKIDVTQFLIDYIENYPIDQHNFTKQHFK